MENFNPQNIGPNQTPPKRSRKPSMLIVGFVASFVALMVTLFGTGIVDRLGATITEGAVPVGTGLYIPNYTASPGDEGFIDIKTQATLSAFDSMSFTLNYSPVDALTFSDSPINLVFNNTTPAVTASAFQIATSPQPGKLVVTMILNSPVVVTDPGVDPTLFRLATQISSNVPLGQVIDLSVSDVILLNGVNTVTTPTMVTGDIDVTTTAGANLRVLSSEAIDATHVAVKFNDYVSNMGTSADYAINVDGGAGTLAVTALESGTLYGYDQKTVVLTTASQTGGQMYTVTVSDAAGADPDVTGNSKGTVSTTYDNVVFHGYGAITSSLSDFGMVSATASDYNTLAVTFTDNVDAASVTKSDFALTQIGGGAITISNVTAVSGKQVTLSVDTTSGVLLKGRNYLLTAASSTAILRSSDGAGLGLDRVAFTGTKTGPRIVSTSFNSSTELRIVFDEPIQLPSTPVALNPIGYIYNTESGDAGTLINDTVSGTWNQTISGNTLTLTNASFNAANTNFTYSVGTPTWLTNSMGVPVASDYKTISFWGYGHNAATNTLGNASVPKKDVISISAGSPSPLDFNQVLTGEVTVLYDNGSGTMQSQAVSSVTSVGGVLQITMAAPLDPANHYLVRIVDTVAGNNTLGVKDVVMNRTLAVNSATALSSSQLRVTFSGAIDERSVTQADFTVNDGADLTLTGISFDPGYTSVVLTTDSGGGDTLDAGTVYRVTAAGATAGVYGNSGNALNKNSTVMAGYQTIAAQSPVSLQTAVPSSSTKVRLTFSGNMDASTLTPINVSVYGVSSVNPLASTPVTISGITQVNASTYDVTTSVQTADRNYFVTFSNVKDSNGLLISNKKTINFLGFTTLTPVVNGVTPNALVNNADTSVILSGKNLNLVATAKVGTTSVVIADQPANGTSLTLTVPAGMDAGSYNISLTNQASTVITVSNAIVVNDAVAPFQVVSSSSQGIPLSVPNDGVAKTTLWVLVEDPTDLANVSSVSVDLRQIGGSGTQEMVKDTGPQPEGGQWYTYQTTVAKTTPTKNDPYLLPVSVRKGDKVINGTIKLKVTKNILSSVAPVVNQIYASPVSVSPDGKTPVKISAQITDEDGAQTITSVVANLGAIGLGFVPLTPITQVSQGQELTTIFYQSADFTVPQTTQVGTYSIAVVVSDETGESTTTTVNLEVSSSVTGPDIDQSISYLAPRKSIPNDEKTAFSLHVYVTDPDGITDVDTVTAHFGAIGLPPTSLLRASDVSATAKSAWFTASGLTIPKTAPIGVHAIEVRAGDQAGGKDSMIFQVDVTHRDTLGDPPKVVSDRNYTTPRIAVNDGSTPLTLYAFVQDDDSDIESVVVNLSQIGRTGTGAGNIQETGSNGSDNSVASGGTCPTGSDTLVCMNPSIREGDSGQWFILPDVRIDKSTAPSPQPYEVDVIVTDVSGKSSRGTLPVYVSSGLSLQGSQSPPEIVAAVPTGPDTLELVFSKEIAATSISPNGAEFTITSRNNIYEPLVINGATISAGGDTVTLTTAPQQANKEYAVSVSSNLKDTVGMKVVKGIGDRANFRGFHATNEAPFIEYVAATDVDTLEVEFRGPLRPSTVKVGKMSDAYGSAFNISIYEEDSPSTFLPVKSVRLLSSNTLELKTENQKGDTRYRMVIDGVASYDGITASTPLRKLFKGYSLKAVAHKAASGQADLNGDGKVDFSDFTIFSSVYGTSYLNSQPGGEQTGQPLGANPDSTVPHTSETDNQ